MLFRRFLCLLVFSFACVAGKANAETKIEDFYGSYTGGGHVTDHSEPFSESRRDFALIIGPLPGGGFEVAWSTVKRKGDDTDPAEVELSEHEARFRPADKGGIFHDVEKGIAFGPGPMTWARLKDDLLVVYRVQIGIRLVLPVVALLVIGGGIAAALGWRHAESVQRRRLCAGLAVIATAWGGFSALHSWPHAV